MLPVSLFKTLYFCNSGFISAVPKDTWSLSELLLFPAAAESVVDLD